METFEENSDVYVVVKLHVDGKWIVAPAIYLSESNVRIKQTNKERHVPINHIASASDTLDCQRLIEIADWLNASEH